MDSEILTAIEKEPALLVYFSQPACSVCTVLKPKIIALAEKYNIPFLYINTIEQPFVRGQHLVFAVPTIILFQNGREITRWSRTIGVGQVESFLQRITRQ